MSKTSWADASEEDLQNQEVDKDGFKYVTEYITRDNKKYKVTKKIKLVKKVHKVNKNVQERKKWKAFGIAAQGGELDDGSQISTTISEPVSFERIGETALQTVTSKDEQLLEKLQAQIGAAKNKIAGGATGSSTGPSLGSSTGGAYRPPQLADKKDKADIFGGAGKYVPPSQRSASSGDRSSSGGMRDDDKRTVRVSNLGPDVTERDLRVLFAKCGSIERCFLATDKMTRESKGFAFITFATTTDAQTAIDKLNGRGLDHLILSVEWAKPSGPRNN